MTTLYIIFLILAMVVSMATLIYVLIDIILVHRRARFFNKKEEENAAEQTEDSAEDSAEDGAEDSAEDSAPMENVTEDVV